MAIIAEQHLALMVGPVRVAATGAVASHDVSRAFNPLPKPLEPIVAVQLEWSRVWAEGAAAGLQESLRRSRENPRPDLGEPDVPVVIAEVVASLAEAYAALRTGREQIRRADMGEHAEPLAGRYGEIAAQLADWATIATEAQRRLGERELRAGVDWGPHPRDARVGAPVALALSTSFAMAAALGAMATIDDNRLANGSDADLQPIFEIAPQALWSATELATGVAISLEHLVADGHPLPDDPLDIRQRCLESEARYREAVALQLEDLERYQPADAAAARPGYVQVLNRVDQHLELLNRELGERG